MNSLDLIPPIKAPADLLDASGQSVLFVRFSLPRADLVSLFNGGPYGDILGGPAEDKTTQALLCAALQEALYDSDSGPSLAGFFDFIPAPADQSPADLAQYAAWNEGYNARCDDESGNPDKPTLNPYQAPALPSSPSSPSSN